MIERTATELPALLSRGEITAEALTDQYLQAIRQRDPQVQAFLHVEETGDTGASANHRGTSEARRAAGASGRHSGGDQGSALHARPASHLRQQDAAKLSAAL